MEHPQEVKCPMKKDKSFRPDRVLSYFRVEWFPLLLVTLSGLVYNISAGRAVVRGPVGPVPGGYPGRQ